MAAVKTLAPLEEVAGARGCVTDLMPLAQVAVVA